MRRPALLLYCVCVSACEAADPAGPLTGQWADPQSRFIATEDDAWLDLGCEGVTIDDPIQLEKDGSFKVSGKHYRFWQRDVSRKALVVGSIDGTSLSLVVVTEGAAGSLSLTLDAAGEMIAQACPT